MSEKRTRILILSDIHYCRDGWYGVTQEEKRTRLIADLEREYKRDPYDVLLLLGDYSLDHWFFSTKGTWLGEGRSDTRIFVGDCLASIAPEGCEVRMIAGNHEQYGHERWQEFTGFKRQDYLLCGDVLFLLLDTFGGDLDPTEHSDGTYTGADIGYIREKMAEFPDKKVILLAHSFGMVKESDEFKQLLASEERILCLFCGHNHTSRINTTGEDAGNKPLIYTGNYSYSGEKNFIRCLPGWRELILTDTGLTSKYCVPAHTYKMGAVTFTNEYAEQDEIGISFEEADA